MNRVQLYHAAL
ncbi:MAG: hypothetical protein GX847_09520 [Clostridiales bacterium]|nr:hypothetical protein [Clostridiales bacterium]